MVFAAEGTGAEMYYAGPGLKAQGSGKILDRALDGLA
jgi:hypothetical protein